MDQAEPTCSPERRIPGPRRRPGAPAGPVEVRRAVLDAAAALFAERGVEHVSLRDIAARADVKLPLIGRYVGTRGAVIDAVLTEETERVAESLRTGSLELWQVPTDPDAERWAKLLASILLAGPDAPIRCTADPLEAASRSGSGHSRDESRIRAAQCLALVLGWTVFEPYLVEIADATVSTHALRRDLERLVELVLSLDR